MSHGSKQDELARRARQAFLKEERVHESERRIVDEQRRHDDVVAKTTRLRDQRIAKEAAEREAASKTKPVERAQVRNR
jgi:hypothetical protein